MAGGDKIKIFDFEVVKMDTLELKRILNKSRVKMVDISSDALTANKNCYSEISKFIKKLQLWMGNVNEIQVKLLDFYEKLECENEVTLK